MSDMEYFQCTKCGDVKSRDHFYKRAARPKGVLSQCKQCSSDKEKAYYKANPIKKLEKQKKHQEWLAVPENKERAKQFWRNEARYLRKQIIELVHKRKAIPCTDCGKQYPYYVMDFDHVDPNTKVANIGQLSKWRSIESISKEMDKCEVVCANCHRERTHGRTLSSDCCNQNGDTCEEQPKTD